MDGQSELFRDCLMQMVEIYRPSEDGARDSEEPEVTFPSILSVDDSNMHLSNSCLVLSPTEKEKAASFEGESNVSNGSQTSLDTVICSKM